MTTTKKNHEKETPSESLNKEPAKGEQGEPEQEPMPETPETTAPEDKKDEPQGADQEKYLRLMADFQNYKRRTEKERLESHTYANEKILTQLLDVLDNFERALEQESQEEAPFREGMTLIFNQFKDVLVKSGLEEIQSLHAEFDPRLHHAILMDQSGSAKSGHVSEVLQKGYTYKGRLLRAAVVKVAE